ncbi:hypothetical protein A2T82_31545 [Burkholderia cenocepacia]|nr:hypothetical protein A2T82_31545 [Burkholderia cenocepacia]
MHSVSLINLASLREVESAMGQKLDPLRFRANIYFDGGEPWEEFDWMDKEIRLGTAAGRVCFRTRRCPATDVNLKTAERDTKIPQFLRKNFGHGDLGVYAEICTGGKIASGDWIGLASE